ncbi:MAG: nucleotide exchange factor GrpE [Blastocatellia bacterium]|nr:nucleotide exchange factor GrpE [Blastocatellia bacterium]
MDPNQEINNIGEIADETDNNDSASVDDFIKELEAKEKDLHITADTTIIEISESFEDGEIPEFLKADLKPEPRRQAVPLNALAPKSEKHGASADLEKEIAGLREKLSKVEADRDEIVVSSRRRAKDFESFKGRTERERKETFQNQVGNLATQMLPALDNLNRAVDFAMAMTSEKRAEIQQFFDGILLVNQQINDVLGEMGIQPISSVGESFDPHYHEAVATEDSGEFQPNTISAELLRGYRIGDRVIRHSMVRVACVPTLRAEDGIVDTDSDLTSQEPETSDLAQ